MPTHQELETKLKELRAQQKPLEEALVAAESRARNQRIVGAHSMLNSASQMEDAQEAQVYRAVKPQRTAIENLNQEIQKTQTELTALTKPTSYQTNQGPYRPGKATRLREAELDYKKSIAKTDELFEKGLDAIEKLMPREEQSHGIIQQIELQRRMLKHTKGVDPENHYQSVLKSMADVHSLNEEIKNAISYFDESKTRYDNTRHSQFFECDIKYITDFPKTLEKLSRDLDAKLTALDSAIKTTLDEKKSRHEGELFSSTGSSEALLNRLSSTVEQLRTIREPAVDVRHETRPS